VLGDKWDTSFLDRASPRGRVYSFASASANPAGSGDRIGRDWRPATGSVRARRRRGSCGAAASYRGAQGVAATRGLKL